MDLPVLDIGSYGESDYTVTEDMVIKGMHPGALSIKTNGNHEITLNNVTGVIYLDFSSSMNIKLKGENRLNYIRSIGVELCDFTIDDAGDDGGTLIVIDDGTPLAGNFIINGGTVKAKATTMGGPAVIGSLTVNGGAVYIAGGRGAQAVGNVVSIISKEAPSYFRYSIDECFVYLDGMENFNLQQWGEHLHKRIKKEVGMPVSIGLAPNKTLAKIASKLAKKFEAYRHCCIIDNDENRIAALKWLPVEDVWGIGRRYAEKLQAHPARPV